MRFVSTLLVIIFFVLAPACGRQDQDKGLTVLSGMTMGTSYTIKLGAQAAPLDQEYVRQGIERIFNDVNLSMSTYLDDSELSGINSNLSTDRIPVSDELAQLLATAQEISWLTNGAFDITIGPVVNLWGFGPAQPVTTIPAREKIDQALARSGYQKIIVGFNPGYIQKQHPEIYLDLSGIAKGYGVDKIAGYLDMAAIDNYMIEVGGEIRAKGVNASGSSWRIGIEKPVTAQRQVQRVISLGNLGMATSGDYRNYFEIDGKHYSHIIDPATGYPVAHNLVSVTVLDPSATRADALATALLVMGPDAGFRFAGDNDITAMFIIRDGGNYTENYTGAFEDHIITE